MANRSISALISLAVLALGVNVGCSTSGSASNTGATAASEQLIELTRRYETGAISKEDYDRQRAALQASRDREILQSGSPLNESMRGFAR